jgi:hypothetical protein
MSDLSAYIAIGVVLDNSGPGPVIRINDTSAYPLGVAQNVKGILNIQEPDGISVGNTDFTHPDIYYSAGQLVQAVYPLRLANNQRFQSNGVGYTITYQVQATGYSNTTLVKTFTFNYNPVTQVITPGFDNFTPSLKVVDATSYGQAGFNFVSVNQQWGAVINNVLGVNQSISGSGVSFDLNYQGNYYDSGYQVTLTAIVSYQLPGLNTFVTLLDKYTLIETFQSEIPPTLLQLLASLTTLKSQLDAAQNNCATFAALQDNYGFAVSVYTHMIDRGQTGSLSGLSDYVYQLQQIFNNGVTPTIVNTGGIIPPYNWSLGTGGGLINWSSVTGKPTLTIMQWTVGQAGFPAAGTNTATNAGFVNSYVLVFRNFERENVTKPFNSATVTFGNNFIQGEDIYILGIPVSNATIAGTVYAYVPASAPATGNYTVVAPFNYILLADLTGQANRNIILPVAPVAGQILTVKNNNTAGSNFFWTFTGGSVLDSAGNAVTTLNNQSVYQLVFNGTTWDINN